MTPTESESATSRQKFETLKQVVIGKNPWFQKNIELETCQSLVSFPLQVPKTRAE
jgi:hypothetical protein